MPEVSDKIAELIISHLKGELTAAGNDTLQQWMMQSEANRAIAEEFLNEEHLKEGMRDMLSKELVWQRLKENISSRPVVHRVHFLRTAWFRYAAAIILLIGVGVYYYATRPLSFPRSGNLTGASSTAIKPGSNKVILTLASGKKIELDNNNNNNKTPLLVKEGAVFDPSEAGQKLGVASYNTITTPKGSQYQLILPDGTKVWLNAASSIKFPTAFTGSIRKVETTGEIYFEVSANKTAPFVVSTKGMEVQVLGTSFNVNAYQEEETLKTSLLEGAVKVNNQLLSPGQAYINGKIAATNLQQDIAWKNGIFNFNDIPLKEAMNQLARWYDVEVVYEGKLPPFDFYGEIGRDLSLNQVLNILSGMGGVNFRLEGKKLIVSK